MNALSRTALTLLVLATPPFPLGAAERQESAQAALDRAAALYRAGQFEEAAAAFAEAADLDPGALGVWESLGWAYRKSGHGEQAREVWLRVLKVDPKRPGLWNQVAAIDIEREEWSSAAESLEKSLELQPTDAHVQSRLAMVLESAGRTEEAARAYEELLALDRENLTSILRLASFYERTHRDEEALRVLEDASRRLPGFAHIFRLHVARLEARQGDAAYAAGNFTDAVSEYREAVTSNPREPRYLENLGWAHRKAGELAEAVEVWRVALKRNPSDTALMRHLADALRESGETEEARRLYLEAWRIAPGSDGAVPYRLAELALAENDPDEAVQWATKLLGLPRADEIWSPRLAGLFAESDQPQPGIDLFRSREPSSRAPAATLAAESRLWAVAAGGAREGGDFDAAVGSYREALRLDPGNRAALRDLGWTQWMIADWQGCAETWNRLASLHPDETDAWNLLTHLHLYRRHYEAAIRTASKSLAIDPDQPAQSLKLARALHWSERYREAKDLAEELADEHPDDVDIQRFWADLMMQYHDFERGLVAWQRVFALGGEDARAEFFYVRSLYELGRYETALSEARRFAEQPSPHEGLFRLLADDALLRGERVEASQWLHRLAERAPQKVEVWMELSSLESDLGSYERAMATVERAESFHPDSVELETARANLLRRAGRSEEAFAIYRHLHELHPESREVFWGFLQTASETHRDRLALEILDSNQDTFLKPYEVELQRARLLYALGEGGRARDLLTESANRARGEVAVPILLYHGLGDHPRTPAMPVARFDSQMKALRDNGYTALSLEELDRIWRGELEAPRKPIVITFDDARIDSFVLADPILERYGMKATMFVPTGLILDDHPFFADWEMLRRFASTGRWDLEAHGHHAHDLIQIDSEGTEGGFLVNRQWLAEDQRLESEDEYLRRVEADYRQVKLEIESRIPGASVVGYAFPFSEAGQESTGNAPNASKVNEAFLRASFRFGFLQDANGYNEPGPGGSPFLKRYSVPRDMDGDELLRQLAREHPRARALMDLARMQMWTGYYARSRRTWETLTEESPSLRGETSFFLASIDYQLGSLRAARSHLEAAKRTERGVRPEDVLKLERRIAWEEAIRIEPRFSLFEDSAERTNREQSLGFSTGALAPLEVRASFGTVTFAEKSFEPFEAVEGDLGLLVQASPHFQLTARVRQRDRRSSGPDSTNYWAGFELRGDRAELLLQGGRQDVDTWMARRAGIDLQQYRLQPLLRLTPSVWAQLDARYGEYSDGNRREDLTLRLTLRPWSDRGLRVGAASGWTDNRIQSPAYYTPAELRFARGLVSYSQGFASGWSVDASVELGWANDALRGDRFTAYARGHAVQAWTSRFRSSLGWTFSSSPGYESWSLLFGLHYGFVQSVSLEP